MGTLPLFNFYIYKALFGYTFLVTFREFFFFFWVVVDGTPLPPYITYRFEHLLFYERQIPEFMSDMLLKTPYSCIVFSPYNYYFIENKGVAWSKK